MSHLQKIFDIVVAHARKQRCRALSNDGTTCVYRDDKGRSCFVGVLIPDSEYKEDMELRNIDDWWRMEGNHYDTTNFLRDLMPATLCQFIAEDEKEIQTINFMRTLQKIHDSVSKVEEETEAGLLSHWEIKFAEIAEDYGLNYSAASELVAC